MFNNLCRRLFHLSFSLCFSLSLSFSASLSATLMRNEFVMMHIINMFIIQNMIDTFQLNCCDFSSSYFNSLDLFSTFRRTLWLACSDIWWWKLWTAAEVRGHLASCRWQQSTEISASVSSVTRRTSPKSILTSFVLALWTAWKVIWKQFIFFESLPLCSNWSPFTPL